MLVAKLLQGVIAILGVTILFWIGIATAEWYEHGHPGLPSSYTARLGPFHKTFALPFPPPLAFQRDAAVAGRNVAVKNEWLLIGSINRQTSSIRFLSARSSVALAASRVIVARSVAQTQAAERSHDIIAGVLASLPTGSSECTKALAVDDKFIQTLLGPQ